MGFGGSQYIFPIKDHTVNILGFWTLCSLKAMLGNMETSGCGCSSKTLLTKIGRWVGMTIGL